MKLAWFLFSIYVVSLSLLPCNDIDDCGSFAKTELHKNHSQDKNTDSQDDLCAPFCSCTCCGVHGFQFQNHIFKKKKSLIVPIPENKMIFIFLTITKLFI